MKEISQISLLLQQRIQKILCSCTVWLWQCKIIRKTLQFIFCSEKKYSWQPRRCLGPPPWVPKWDSYNQLTNRKCQPGARARFHTVLYPSFSAFLLQEFIAILNPRHPAYNTYNRIQSLPLAVGMKEICKNPDQPNISWSEFFSYFVKNLRSPDLRLNLGGPTSPQPYSPTCLAI